jgi:hypothetical protein
MPAAVTAPAPGALLPSSGGGGGGSGGGGPCERAVCARFGCTNPSRCTAPEVCSCAGGWQGFDCGVRSSGGATLWSLLLGTDPAHLAAATRGADGDGGGVGGGGDGGGVGGDGGGGGSPAEAPAAAARFAFLEPVLKPTVAAAQLRAPLHRGWGAAGAAGVAGAEWRDDAPRWRDAARARGWAAWRGLPPQRWWLEVSECTLAPTLTPSLTFTLTLILTLTLTLSLTLSRWPSGRRSTSPSRARPRS